MTPMSCVFLVFRLLAFTMCLKTVPVQMSEDPAPLVERSMGKRLLLEGVPNFAKVTPTLYRGGQPDGRDSTDSPKWGSILWWALPKAFCRCLREPPLFDFPLKRAFFKRCVRRSY
jgi:hypothetical protein